jgi:hypothetical protein
MKNIARYLLAATIVFAFGCGDAMDQESLEFDVPRDLQNLPPPEPGCIEHAYYKTTTASVNQCSSACTGYNVLGQQVSCSYWHVCTEESIWEYYDFCVDGHYGGTMKWLDSKAITSCGSSFQTNCPYLVNGGSCGAC